MLYRTGRLLIALAIAMSASHAFAAPQTIENQSLTVVCDDATGTFSAAEKPSGAVFLKDGKLHAPVAKVVVEPTADPDFGPGRRIAITHPDASVTSLELYNSLPFLFVRGTLHNSGAETLNVPKLVPVTFNLDLGKPAQELRTLGTAGLTAPDKNPGSYLFLTLADPATRRGVVAGWMTNDRGSGVVFSSIPAGQANAVAFRAQIDYGRLLIPAGQAATLETLVVGFFADARLGEEQYADAMAKHYHIQLRPQAAGYCTWYSDQHDGAGDEKSLVQLAEFVAQKLKPFGFDFVQIDDHWQDGGEYNGPRRGFDRVKPDGDYPHGMHAVAAQLEKLGLTTGIWFMPFARNHQDPEYKDRQHWFVKRANGKPYETAWGGTSLDLTVPAVQEHLATLVRKIHSWGVNYFKLDGLWTGSATEQIYVNDGYRDDHIGNNAPFHNSLKTNLEAYRDGLKLVRTAAGPDVFLSGCNVSQNMRTLGGSIGLVDSMRIGPDNGPNWGDYRNEIAKSACGSIITGPIRGSRLYFLNGRVWWNDPDPTYVRQKVPLNQARMITSWVALSGAFYLNSDWIPALPSNRLDIIKRTIPAHGATARPIDYFDSIMPTMWLVTDERQAVRRDVLGLFNWEDGMRSIGCTAAKAGLAPAKTYYAFDFWSDRPLPSFRGKFKFDVRPQSCLAVAVRAAAGHPVLVSTSRHVTQGIVDVRDEKWDPAAKELSGTSAVVGADPYELRIAGLREGKPWMIAAVAVSEEDRAAGVTIEAKHAVAGEKAWGRVVIKSPANRAVRWRVTFTAP